MSAIRNLCRAAPGGALTWAAFTVDARRVRRGPSAECRASPPPPGFTVLAEEDVPDARHGTKRRLLARRPLSDLLSGDQGRRATPAYIQRVPCSGPSGRHYGAQTTPGSTRSKPSNKASTSARVRLLIGPVAGTERGRGPSADGYSPMYRRSPSALMVSNRRSAAPTNRSWSMSPVPRYTASSPHCHSGTPPICDLRDQPPGGCTWVCERVRSRRLVRAAARIPAHEEIEPQQVFRFGR